MSTAQRRRGRSLHLELPNGAPEDLPPVAAVFLVLFDVRKGYEVAWKESIPGLELTDSVEFKSLPSGLHHAKEDLIYFIHDGDYAGVSAFANRAAAESERNALMLAVGALVPLSYGRMGKSWKHAEGLTELARTIIKDPEDTQPLEDFWQEHQVRDEDDAPSSGSQAESPSNRNMSRQDQSSPELPRRTRNRAISTASALAPPSKGLSSHHPALSLPLYIDTFGPLMFPLFKAALLRKRILLVGHAPVELSCNFVYNVSVLSGIPASIIDLVPLEPLPTRLNPLFSVGIHDMDVLASDQASPSFDDPGYGWIACTTDDILGHKTQLYDVLVSLPNADSARGNQKSWPRLATNQGSEIKATQRDSRRYQTLLHDLRRYGKASTPFSSVPADPEASPSGLADLNQQETFDDASSTIDEKLIEPQSWSALAYSSFMWWASAGERRTDLDEESDHDSALLRDFGPRYANSSSHGESSHRSRSANGMIKSPGGIGEGIGREAALIAYFHRFTSLIFRVLADAVNGEAASNDGNHAEGDGDDEAARTVTGEDGEEEQTLLQEPGKVYISSEDITRMGLDVWSESDRRFVAELIGLYWGREATVEGGRVECCGVRIC